MSTLSQTSRTSLTLTPTASLQSAKLSAKNDFFARSQPRLSQRSSVSQLGTERHSGQSRASWGFALRGFNPHVTGISGNGTSSTYTVQQMHNGGTWQFFRNGVFRFVPRGLGTFARTDLFPVTGNYRVNGSILRFSGSRTSSSLTSRNFASVSGQISLRSGQADVTQRTVLNMTANINNTPFGQTIDRTVRLNLQMVRVA